MKVINISDHGIDDDEISRLEFVLSNHIDETNKENGLNSMFSIYSGQVEQNNVLIN